MTYNFTNDKFSNPEAFLTGAQLRIQYKMFGCSEETLDNMVTKSNNIPMLVASILSDAQESHEFGDSESVRMLINRAKHIIFEYMDCRELNPLKK